MCICVSRILTLNLKDTLIEHTTKPGKGTRSLPGPRTRALHTLDPNRLTEDDFMRISETTNPRKKIMSGGCYQEFSFHYGSGKPFPPNTRGFLYYHSPAFMPPTAGEIRFRLTQSSSPKDFYTGSDLLLPNGLPWSLPLVRLAHGLYHRAEGLPFRQGVLVELLAQDKLVNTATLNGIAVSLKAAGFGEKPQDLPTNIIHDLDQLVNFSFQIQALSCMFVGENRVSPVRIHSPFVYRSIKQGHSGLIRPFSGQCTISLTFCFLICADYCTGSALCRFEKSPIPWSNGLDTLVLRVMKVVAPIMCTIKDYDGYLPMPKEGELVKTHRHGAGSANVVLPCVTWRMSAVKAKDEAVQDLLRKANAYPIQ